MSGEARKEFERKLADDFISQIKSGEVGAWSSGWTNLGGAAMPHNPKGRPYSGINTVILWLRGFDYNSNTWGTYNAWKEVARKHAIKEGNFELKVGRDGKPYKHTTEWFGVKKGEEGTNIILWKPLTYKSEKENKTTGEMETTIGTTMLMRVFTVFNRDQTGLPEIITDTELEEAEDFNRPEQELENCLNYYIEKPNRKLIGVGEILPSGEKAEEPEWVIKSGEILLKHGGDRAFYTSGRDRIALPLREQFNSNARYLSTKGHEIIHSTGHPLRLNRNLGNSFGSEDYAKEELIAEFGTAFLIGSFGIQGELRNVEYINNWASVLSKEPRFLITAAQRAQKAVNYVLDPWLEHEVWREQEMEVLAEKLEGKTIVIEEQTLNRLHGELHDLKEEEE